MAKSIKIQHEEKKKSPSFYEARPRKSTIAHVNGELVKALVVNCPIYGPQLLKLWESKDFLGLVMFEFSYENLTPLEAASVRQILALFSKDASLDIGIDKEATALATFLETEQLCHQTNRRIGKMYELDEVILIRENSRRGHVHALKASSDYEAISPLIRRLLKLAQEVIRDILGPVPCYDEMIFQFGPKGSTTVTKRTTARFKLEAVPVCCHAAVEEIPRLYESLPLYAYVHRGRVRTGWGVFALVPKNSKTFRSMIMESLLNTAVQKGIGGSIVTRLADNGPVPFDLRMEWVKNKMSARRGSVDGEIATVDGKSASDLIAYMLVQFLLLLVPDWFSLMDKWRTAAIMYKKKTKRDRDSEGRIKPSVHVLQKFSSMGNGYTFELESLIFYALGYACCVESGFTDQQLADGNLLSIFGDDLIIPCSVYPLYVELAEFCGFIINKDKTYYFGRFRESCGGDYLDGIDIRPFYVKDLWTSARLVGFLNHCYAAEVQILTPDLREKLIQLIPERDRLYGPAGFGDGHIHSNEFMITPTGGWKKFSKFTYVLSDTPTDLTDYVRTESVVKLSTGWSGGTFETLKKREIQDHTPLEKGDQLIGLYNNHIWQPDEDKFTHGESDPYVIGAGEKVTRIRIHCFGIMETANSTLDNGDDDMDIIKTGVKVNRESQTMNVRQCEWARISEEIKETAKARIYINSIFELIRVGAYY